MIYFFDAAKLEGNDSESFDLDQRIVFMKKYFQRNHVQILNFMDVKYFGIKKIEPSFFLVIFYPKYQPLTTASSSASVEYSAITNFAN